MPVFAIGHSTRPLPQFIELLAAHGVTLLADIRTVPRSRHNPQYALDSLAAELPAHGIEYQHMPALGGLRRPKPDSTNLGWENTSFRGYADYMQTPAFDAALNELISMAESRPVAIMCAEGNPFRCHRNLVADALTARGVPVYHIVSRKTARLHILNPRAVVQDGHVSYPMPEPDAANKSAENDVQ